MTEHTTTLDDDTAGELLDEDELRELIRDHRDSLPECDCGETMNAEYSRLSTVVRCPTGECRSEGVMAPYWLRRLLPWRGAE